MVHRKSVVGNQAIMAPLHAKSSANAMAPSIRWSFVWNEFPADWQDLLQAIERFAGGTAALTTKHDVKCLIGYVEMKKRIGHLRRASPRQCNGQRPPVRLRRTIHSASRKTNTSSGETARDWFRRRSTIWHLLETKNSSWQCCSGKNQG